MKMQTWMPLVGLLFGLVLAATTGWSIYQQMHSVVKTGTHQEQTSDSGASE